MVEEEWRHALRTLEQADVAAVQKHYLSITNLEHERRRLRMMGVSREPANWTILILFAIFAGTIRYPCDSTRVLTYWSWRKTFSFVTTVDCVVCSVTPRYRARLEQWIVASLCRRNIEGTLRFVERNSDLEGSNRTSEGNNCEGTTDEIYATRTSGIVPTALVKTSTGRSFIPGTSPNGK